MSQQLRSCGLRLLLAVLVVPGLWQAGARGADAPKDGRPSILLILADNWAWPHAGACGDRVVQTPTFDRVAGQGVLFTHAFCANPSCTPARAALLTGQATHRLEDSGNLWSTLPKRFAVYPELLQDAGYRIGRIGKGWGPGSVEAGGRTENPAGPEFPTFAEFLRQVPADRPFCFWYGHRNPHRSYVPGSGAQAGLKPEAVTVPPYLPDTPEVRNDILDYYLAVQKFDADAGQVLAALQASGRADNTLVVIAGDNGWQMPHGLATVYDGGTRVPLVVRWPARLQGGRTAEEFVDFTDLAPTFLEAAGLKPPAAMTGRSLLGLLSGQKTADRDHVFLERERHANVRQGDRSYPCRAIRTRDFLYVRNLQPDLWPAGDPELYFAVGPFGDVDPSPTREVILTRRTDPEIARFYQAAFAKRPAEELYDLRQDPGQIVNVAGRAEYAAAARELRTRLDRWMQETGDPRAANPTDDRWDRYAYHGKPKARAADAPTRPNIVFVLADDVRWDDLACMGHPFVQTPHIDRLAREGALCKNAFATTPLCSPSRACFLTGRYAHAHGVRDNTNHDALSHRLVTFLQLLQKSGYGTAFLGKWHMGTDDSPRPGIDHWLSFKGQGQYFDPEVNVNGRTEKLTGYATDLLNERAVEYVRRAHDRPFVLYLSHKAVHPNLTQRADGTISDPQAAQFVPAGRHRGLYRDATIPRRPSALIERLDGKPALMQKISDLPPLSRATGTSDEVIRDRLRMLASVDDGIGQIIKALEDTKQLDSTVFIFTSDHGYFYGEHGLSVERRLAYEETARVPLLVRYPPLIRPGTTIDPFVLSVDIAPTLLTLAGAPVPADMHGRSIVPLLKGESKPLRESFLIEYFSDTVFPRMQRMGYQAVRTARWKYIRYTDQRGMDELYDLETDPYEMRNRIDDPAAGKTLQELRAELERLVRETP